MIPLLINVEMTGKGVEKAELSINAGDVFVHREGFDETRSRASLSASPPRQVDTFHFLSEDLEDFWEE